MERQNEIKRNRQKGNTNNRERILKEKKYNGKYNSYLKKQNKRSKMPLRAKSGIA